MYRLLKYDLENLFSFKWTKSGTTTTAYFRRIAMQKVKYVKVSLIGELC